MRQPTSVSPDYFNSKTTGWINLKFGVYFFIPGVWQEYILQRLFHMRIDTLLQFVISFFSSCLQQVAYTRNQVAASLLRFPKLKLFRLISKVLWSGESWFFFEYLFPILFYRFMEIVPSAPNMLGITVTFIFVALGQSLNFSWIFHIPLLQ